MEKKTVHSPDISCGRCVAMITRELEALRGVGRVRADLGTKTVTVEWEPPATWEDIRALLVELGYPPTN